MKQVGGAYEGRWWHNPPVYVLLQLKLEPKLEFSRITSIKGVHPSGKKFTWSELSAGSGCSSIGLGVHDEDKEVVEGVDDTETSTSSVINPC